jgi:hypothetical protein
MTTAQDRKRQIQRALDSLRADPVRVGARGWYEQACEEMFAESNAAIRQQARSKAYWKAHYEEQARQRAVESRLELEQRRAGIYTESTTRTGTNATKQPADYERLLRRLGLNAESRRTIGASLARSSPGDGVRLSDGSEIKRLADGSISVHRGKDAVSRLRTATAAAEWQLLKK